MKKKLFWFILIIGVSLICASVNADIYSWTDKNGVRHFSNTPPEEAMSDVSESGEIEYDAQKDRERTIKEEKHYRQKVGSVPEVSQKQDLSPQEKEKIDREIRSTWNGMRKALRKGDINKAVEYHHPSSREQYRKAYQELSKPRKK
jgi:Domain of unknown function (DUF4124)